MNLNGNNNVIPTGFDVFQNSGADKTGAMISRSSSNLGLGSVSLTTVKLGVSNSVPYNIEVRGMAIETVYVPASTSRPIFGDGNGTTESINALHYTDNTATTNSILPIKCDAKGLDDSKL
ncbi:MAG: hypothetical protein ABI378_06850 [Chitinophagaceae bacterium]